MFIYFKFTYRQGFDIATCAFSLLFSTIPQVMMWVKKLFIKYKNNIQRGYDVSDKVIQALLFVI